MLQPFYIYTEKFLIIDSGYFMSPRQYDERIDP